MTSLFAIAMMVVTYILIGLIAIGVTVEVIRTTRIEWKLRETEREQRREHARERKRKQAEQSKQMKVRLM